MEALAALAVAVSGNRRFPGSRRSKAPSDSSEELRSSEMTRELRSLEPSGIFSLSALPARIGPRSATELDASAPHGSAVRHRGASASHASPFQSARRILPRRAVNGGWPGWREPHASPASCGVVGRLVARLPARLKISPCSCLRSSSTVRASSDEPSLARSRRPRAAPSRHGVLAAEPLASRRTAPRLPRRRAPPWEAREGNTPERPIGRRSSSGPPVAPAPEH